MKKVIILLVILLTGVEAFSQDSLKTSKTKYKSRIFETTIYCSGRQVEGHLVHITDSSIVIAQPIAFTVSNVSRDSFMQIGYAEIDQVLMQRPNKVARGALTGFLIGTGIGIISGLAISSGTKGSFLYSPPATMAVTGAVMVGTVGTIIGIIAGAMSIRSFQINNSKKKMQQMKEVMVSKIY